jgi:hypothetical protein
MVVRAGILNFEQNMWVYFWRFERAAIFFALKGQKP